LPNCREQVWYITLHDRGLNNSDILRNPNSIIILLFIIILLLFLYYSK
jgi:hypothetical protein